MWDLVIIKNLHELLAEFPIKLAQPRSGAVVKSCSSRSLVRTHAMTNYFCNISWPSLHWPSGNAYMCDQRKFYYDFEHSISEKIFTFGTKLNFITTCVDGRLSYQSSYGFASGQILRRSQGTLLPSSGEPKVSNSWNNVQRKDSI
jgi:hypothetical protein